ncbi:NAD(P)H-binding protein [Nannocystis bainbridge]|uniref:NAD(P)H-binding protein n=1 Tax=Nannocystis bainbridge TaxID=2995303 RepID=A0ABT5E3B3_9BACT|nr:NAD(P)H-binding protein [Nannocystis bainbridge]MDC0719252.1 NAD(P)H-binding protein [Nannocystis bainbridge]
MQVAVAGASGFIGQATVHALLQAGHAVVGLSRGRRGRFERPGLTWRDADASRGGPELAAALAGCEAVVNLVGIKRTEQGQTFASAHEAAVTALTTAMQTAGIRRLIHVSVAGPQQEPASPTPYLASKRAGERLVMSSGTDWTILRPGPVAGPGDDFVNNLAATLRHAGVFPAPDGGHAPLQPVLVEDVARAVAAALERPAAIGRCYDVVGPEVLTLRAVVQRVADALGLPVTLIPCPAPLLAVAVAGLEKLPAPLLTRSQLGLLTHGLVGDPGPAAAELGVVTQPLTEARIVELAAGVEPWLGLSLRLRRGDEDMFFKTCSKGAVHLAWLVPLAVGLIWALGSLTPHVWWRMLAANVVLVPLCLALVRLPWRELWRPSLRGLARGIVAAAALLVAGWIGSQVLFAVTPEARVQVAAVYGWVYLLPAGAAAVLLPLIAAAEEVVWRGAVAFAVASRAGPWWGAAASAAAFAVAHVSLGVPALVVAAAGAGFFWAWLGLKTRSLFAVLVCHVVWDACVVVLRLY